MARTEFALYRLFHPGWAYPPQNPAGRQLGEFILIRVNFVDVDYIVYVECTILFFPVHGLLRTLAYSVRTAGVFKCIRMESKDSSARGVPA